jgi:hypothetical protein
MPGWSSSGKERRNFPYCHEKAAPAPSSVAVPDDFAGAGDLHCPKLQLFGRKREPGFKGQNLTTRVAACDLVPELLS